MHRSAYAQALKVSDADTEKKLCAYSSSTPSSGDGCYKKGDSSNNSDVGLVAVYGNDTNGGGVWPTEKKSSGTANKGATSVAANITAMTKDEKVKVAGHLAKSIEGGD